MKKILAFIAFLFVAVGLMAQDKIINNYGVAGVTNSSASRKTAAYNYVFQVNVPGPYYYALQVRQDDLGGVPANNQSTAYFQGSVDNTNWTNIDTLSYGGSNTYEVLTKTSWKNFDVNLYPWAKPLFFKYLRVNITPSDTIWVKSIWLQVSPLQK